MKNYLLILLLFSTILSAKPLLVNQLFPSLRIVLSTDIKCSGEGNDHKAVAQRIDKLYIPGCWTYEEGHPELVHIEWNKGDFSVLPLSDFITIDEKEELI